MAGGVEIKILRLMKCVNGRLLGGDILVYTASKITDVVILLYRDMLRDKWTRLKGSCWFI